MAIQLIRRYHDGGVSIKSFTGKEAVDRAMGAREVAILTELGKEKAPPAGMKPDWNAPVLIDVQVRLTGSHARKRTN